MNKTSNPRTTLLFCAALAGLWAGSIVTYTVMSINPAPMHTAEVVLTEQDSAGRIFNRDKVPRTTPYDPDTAPPFIDKSIDVEITPAEEVIPGDFEFPTPVVPVAPSAPAVPTAPVVPDTPEVSPTDAITGVFGSLQRLFSGEGNFTDIINIAIAAFAIFGGAQFGSSDMLFKAILSLFSKKGNFNDILEARLSPNAGRRSRRRSRK